MTLQIYLYNCQRFGKMLQYCLEDTRCPNDACDLRKSCIWQSFPQEWAACRSCGFQVGSILVSIHNTAYYRQLTAVTGVHECLLDMGYP